MMARWVNKAAWIALTLLLLVSCGPAVSTITPAPTPPRPTATLAPSEPTAIPPTSTPVPPTAAPAPPAASAGGAGLIVFTSERDGDREIYVLDVAGIAQGPADPRQLTDNTADDASPACSPDGTQIAFSSTRDGNRGIYLMNADGTGQRRLSNTSAYESHPDWSPDGTRMAFISERDGNREIYVMNVDGGNLQRLTDDPAEDARPDWSPDGTQILFNSYRDGNWEIYLMNADGTDQRRLTDSANWELFPTWSPDGRRIAYAGARPNQWEQEIYVMEADGTNVLQLTDLSTVSENPAWSPDGTKIAFQSDRDGNFEIYVMNADGSDPQRLTDDPGGDYWPAWSPVLPATNAAFVPLPPLGPSYIVPAQYDEGTVAGQVILPAGAVSTTAGPALDLFFENVATEEVHVLSLRAGQRSYTMTLPAGAYVAYAWTPALAEKGAFTSCRPGEDCADHRLQTITVTAEATVIGVDIADWLPVERPSLVLAGTLIDGTGTGPLADAALVIREERIVAVGPRSEIQIPVDARVVEQPGVTLLPGFINTHVHNTQTARNRRSWARAGVTTVRDLGAPADLPGVFALRDQLDAAPENARAFIAGPLVTVPGGYPTGQFSSLTVTSPEDARQKVDQLIDDGADVIKITMMSRAGPILSPEEATAIVETAHARGVRVSVHVIYLPELEPALDAGVDDIDHMIEEQVPDALIQRMVAAGVVWVPTLEPFDGADSGNLRRFLSAGGVVAMGNDAGYLTGIALGMPIPELEYMHAAGMTPLEIIVASTRNAAYVCDRLSILGTLEVGKYADALVVEGDPLQDLQVLKNVRLVVHGGAIIREENTAEY